MSTQKTKNNSAFTLVELIVVIVILAILATIAFLSFSSQSGSARDSTRLSDISSIKKSVEMYNVNAGTYPTPDNPYSYTYSGGVIWNQGTIGDSAYKFLQKNLSKKVTDPLKGSEYDYSLASNKREYQVAGNFENPTSLERNYNPFDSSSLSPKLSALGGTGANVYISGNYNGVMLKVFTGSTYYFVPTPTLFGLNSGTGNVVYDNTFGSGKDLLPGVNNVAVFDSSKVYASTSSTGLSTTEVTALMVTIQSAYLTGNVTTPAVQAIVAASGAELINIGEGLVKNSLGGGINLSSSENSDPIQNLGSGGIISYYGGYTIHTFLTGGTFDMTGSGTVDVLVVAGGGGGGGIQGGGGGAGGLRYVSSLNVSAQSYMVTVGAGGVGSTARGIKGTNGGNSIFSTVTAIGGGGGGTENYPANSIGSDGGSGGGGSAGNTNANGGAGVAGQGNNGGIGKVVGTLYAGGGGGGGAGSTGVSADNSKGGDGGLGFNSSINGTNTFYAGGGGGGGDNRATTIFGGSGGNGGGGTGGAGELSSINGANGAPNTGGGGGGGAYVSSPITDGKGGNGGSGIVIIRYLTIN